MVGRFREEFRRFEPANWHFRSDSRLLCTMNTYISREFHGMDSAKGCNEVVYQSKPFGSVFFGSFFKEMTKVKQTSSTRTTTTGPGRGFRSESRAGDL